MNPTCISVYLSGVYNVYIFLFFLELFYIFLIHFVHGELLQQVKSIKSVCLILFHLSQWLIIFSSHIYTRKQVPYGHLLSSTDMVQKESEAQFLGLHSNKITFMPENVKVHYRNSRKTSSGWPFIWFYTCSISVILLF